MRLLTTAFLFLMSFSAFSQVYEKSDEIFKKIKINLTDVKSIDVVLKFEKSISCETYFIGVTAEDLKYNSFILFPGFVNSKVGCSDPDEVKTFTSKPIHIEGDKLRIKPMGNSFVDEYLLHASFLIPENGRMEIITIERDE